MPDSRLFKILYYLLEKGHATAPELAEKFEVSARTIYRDIEALSGAGVPVYTEPGRGGGIFLLPGFVLDRAAFSRAERGQLLAAAQTLSATGAEPDGALRSKLAALFETREEDWLEVDFSRWGSPVRDRGLFETLKTAILRHTELRLVYAGANGEQSERTVQPLKLSYRTRAWYLKAFCLTKKDFRLFKLNRILSAESLPQTFAPKAYPEEPPAPPGAYPTVVLRFSAQAAYRVYDEFDAAQVERQENGDLLVHAEMPADAWLTGYLLSFGTQVEVVEPLSLKRLLAEQARAIYEKNRV